MVTSNPYSLERLQQALSAAAEPTRLRLLYLCSKGEHTVSDLVSVLAQSQPRVSRHLKILCDAGLLERFRDGHWRYFRVPPTGQGAQTAAMVLDLLDDTDDVVRSDLGLMMQALGSQSRPQMVDSPEMLRRFHRLIVDQFLSIPVGELLDVGVGNGAILKLLAGKASTAHGVDIDLESRRIARREFTLANLTNCTVRPGDMYRLGYADDRFDTVVLDEVLLSAERPDAALSEAMRVMSATGHLLIVEHVRIEAESDSTARLRDILSRTALRCNHIRSCNDGAFKFLVAMAYGDAGLHERKQAS